MEATTSEIRPKRSGSIGVRRIMLHIFVVLDRGQCPDAVFHGVELHAQQDWVKDPAPEQHFQV
eukprot:3345184-Pyramimonas_sp.AAC.1